MPPKRALPKQVHPTAGELNDGFLKNSTTPARQRFVAEGRSLEQAQTSKAQQLESYPFRNRMAKNFHSVFIGQYCYNIIIYNDLFSNNRVPEFDLGTFSYFVPFSPLTGELVERETGVGATRLSKRLGSAIH